jgi:hypothetical protein
MSTVVKGKFGNHFVDTPGINEYFKFERGEAVNPKRFLITAEDVYIVGQQGARTGASGFGGREFIFWMKDGTVVNLRDIWHVKERTSETINVAKMENVFVPKEGGTRTFSALYGTDVDKKELFMFNIPMVMKKPMLSNELKLLQIEEAILLCREASRKSGDEVVKLCFEHLIAKMFESENTHVLFVDEARDLIDADLELVRLVYDGVSNFEQYEELILESGWQHSMDPFESLLSKLKSSYYEAVTGGNKKSFPELILSLRGELVVSHVEAE